MSASALKSKNGIVGICQHGDLFWDKITDAQVNEVLDIIDAIAPEKIQQRVKARRPAPKYMLWTKRVERMRRIMEARYGDENGSHQVPDWYGLGACRFAPTDRLCQHCFFMAALGTEGTTRNQFGPITPWIRAGWAAILYMPGL